MKAALPAYCAETIVVPTPNCHAGTVTVAVCCPFTEVSGTEPRACSSSRKFTVPVGVPLPCAAATVAVIVTLSFRVTFAALEVNVTLTGLTALPQEVNSTLASTDPRPVA